MTSRRRVRAIVVDHDGGDMTRECVEHLLATEWPRDDLEVVVVDNASTDTTPQQLASLHPQVRVVRSAVNRGFAGGCNLGLRDLDGVDLVALVNNDVTVQPGWLAPLVDALAADATVGAAAPKILFRDRFRAVRLDSALSPRGGGDPRAVGVWLDGTRDEAGGTLAVGVQHAEGFGGPEPGPDGEGRWTVGPARLHVPERAGELVELRLRAVAPVELALDGGAGPRFVKVTPEPAWVRVPVAGAPFDVVNNVGTDLGRDGYGRDRGYQEPDRGQHARAEDVFAWCGAAALLRADYVREVGGFDERLFLYYEDLELAWRGHEHGWRYRYVPDAVVRHRHAATSGERSARKAYFDERNRLLVLTRHGRPRRIARELARYVLVTGSYVRRDVVARWRRHEPIAPDVPLRRARALGGYLRLAPAMWRDRAA